MRRRRPSRPRRNRRQPPSRSGSTPKRLLPTVRLPRSRRRPSRRRRISLRSAQAPRRPTSTSRCRPSCAASAASARTPMATGIRHRSVRWHSSTAMPGPGSTPGWPATDALDTIKLKSSRVCPLVCEHGYQGRWRAVWENQSAVRARSLNDDNECEKQPRRTGASAIAATASARGGRKQRLLSGVLQAPAFTVICYRSAAYRRATRVRAATTVGRPSCRESADLPGEGRDDSQIALAAMFTISANSAVLNTKEMMPCTVAVRRMILSVMPTSETWAVMPITNEK